MRSIDLSVPFDVPRSLTGWKIIGDAVEARFSYMNKPKLHGNVGLGFTWTTDEIKFKHDPTLAWQALAKHVLPRIIDAAHVTRQRILESAIEPTVNSLPRLRLRIEGD